MTAVMKKASLLQGMLNFLLIFYSQNLRLTKAVKIYNIFNMDGRTIEEIWLDCARNMIRDLLLLPDEYVIVVYM